MSKKWSATLRLPKTTFPPRPQAHLREHYIQKSADELYAWQKTNRPANDTFVLHDGPPYANGSLHTGHALNKILKDMVLRLQIQQGRRVEYLPGWDCHGLPIEIKALENNGEKNLSPIEIRKAARNLASNTVLKQMKSFRSFGVMGDWDHRWTTMDPEYEIRQLRLFQKLVKKGLVYRQYKPVYWSPSSKSALAEAELEYKDDHVSTSAWVGFRITPETWQAGSEFGGFAQEIKEHVKGDLFAVIWTTTPWTLPANQAIAIHDDLEYKLVLRGNDGYIVAQERTEEFLAALPDSHPAFAPLDHILPGRFLKELTYVNELRGKSALPQPIIHANFVSPDSGSGLVHLAPGHGFDDYQVCNPLGLPVTAPIDNEGKFTSSAFPDDPHRLLTVPSVTEGGSEAILSLLGTRVLRVQKYRHKYPYDWRTKRPVVIRATEQWFADVASVKDEALRTLEQVQFIPQTGKKRLESFIRGRSEWCISRQRAWGVPIPALYDKNGAAMMTEDVVDHIISVIRERGTSAWWSDPLDDPAWIPSYLSGDYKRGTDTMDVWFDSGSSWTMMPEPADVYLEGSDQHRGWFQSSLLTRVAAGADEGSAFFRGPPFRQLITHGFALDQDGKKMSKSLGNIIEPIQVMDGSLLPPLTRKGKAAKQSAPAYDALGSDALRLWVASSDFTGDVVVGVPSLQAIHVALLKYRNIIKMLLGSVHETARQSVLSTVDRIAIIQLQDTMAEVHNTFSKNEFYKGFAVLNRWVTTELSAFYLEATKDRLYCGDGGGVIEPLLLGFLRMLAPMTPSLVAEAWDHRSDWMKGDSSLAHPLHQLFADPIIDESRLAGAISLEQLRKDMPVLFAVHAAVKAGLERARADKVLGSSLQSLVTLSFPESEPTPCSKLDSDPTTGRVAVNSGSQYVKEVLSRYDKELDAIFVVSKVEILDTNSKVCTDAEWQYLEEVSFAETRVGVNILPPRKSKCARCWRYIAEVEDGLCGRCEAVVKE